MQEDFPKNIVLLWLPSDPEYSRREPLLSSEERFLLRRLSQDLYGEGIILAPLPFFGRRLLDLSRDEFSWEFKHWLDYWRDHWFDYSERWLDEYSSRRWTHSPDFSHVLAKLSYEGVIDGILIVTPSRVEKQMSAESLREISETLSRTQTPVIRLTLGRGGEPRQALQGVPSLTYPHSRSELMSLLTYMSRERGSRWAESEASEARIDESYDSTESAPMASQESAPSEVRDTGPPSYTVRESAAPARLRDELHDTGAPAAAPTGAPAAAPASTGPTTNEVHLGAAVPRALSPSEQFVARFAAYTEGFRDEVRRVLEQEAPLSPPRLDLEVCRWQRGAKVTVRLAADQVDVANPVQTFTWNGTKQVLRFDARVLPEARASVLILRFDIAVEGFPLVTLRPEVAMSLPHRERAATAGFSLTEGIAPTSAFASYASPDRREVLGRIRSLQIFTGIDVFLDNLSIRPGERWKAALDTEIRKRDVFWLFWSRNAKESEWVEWEWRTALALKSLAGIQPHPLEPAEIAPPPKELSALQFGAMYEWYISSLREPWLVRRARMFWHQLMSLFG